jgi:protein-arginine kinase activator protein McsA
MPLICRCCGDSYEKRPRVNPNICSSCAQLLEDDFPASTSHLIELEHEEVKEHSGESPQQPNFPSNPRSTSLPKKQF